jgi:hypothetical protein
LQVVSTSAYQSNKYYNSKNETDVFIWNQWMGLFGAHEIIQMKVNIYQKLTEPNDF